MPYIVEETDRKFIDEGIALMGQDSRMDSYHVPDIEDIAEILRSVPSGKKKGAFNYFVSRLFLNTFVLPDGIHYTETSNAIDVFDNMKTEWTRRILHPYEDKAIEENGDLPEMKQILEMLK